MIIVDDEKAPSLAVYPDDAYAVMNVAKYAKGFKFPGDQELYEKWCVKGALRAFVLLCNGDILRLRRENFVDHEGLIYLNYTPHKTAHSSRRIVRWPVHADIWWHLRDASFDFDAEVFVELNRQMRGLGFMGTKGAYELRKICIDHVYQRFGAEMAVSISGDDIKTISRYYADPSQPIAMSLGR